MITLLVLSSILSAVNSETHNCNSDADCSGLCTYCQNGAGKTPPFVCHAPTDDCCLNDADCKGSYCMNSDGHAQPWKCHGSVAITPVVEEKPTVPDDLHHCTSNADCSGLCTYCQNGAGKTPPFNCHAATNNCCLDDADCKGSYCMNSDGHAQPWKCHGSVPKFLRIQESGLE